MNTLDVTKFGVHELDAKEMVEFDAGNRWKLFPAFYDALMDFGNGFVEGVKDAYK